jgi:hypothetical protein
VKRYLFNTNSGCVLLLTEEQVSQRHISKEKLFEVKGKDVSDEHRRWVEAVWFTG